MVFGLFRKGEKKAAAQPPDGTVVYAVGDIHGCLGLLLSLQQQIKEDMARRDASRRVVVYLGDYVDRGPKSRGVLDHLLTRPLPDCERSPGGEPRPLDAEVSGRCQCGPALVAQWRG